MNTNLLTEADLAKFEADLADLTDMERHILFRLMELHSVEDVLDIIADMEDGDNAAKCHFTDIDPYAKCEAIPAEHQKCNFQIDENGQIHVKNPSACWMPELTLRRQIGDTIYMVSGSYDGSGMLDKKLLRVMVQNAESMEDSE